MCCFYDIVRNLKWLTILTLFGYIHFDYFEKIKVSLGLGLWNLVNH